MLENKERMTAGATYPGDVTFKFSSSKRPSMELILNFAVTAVWATSAVACPCGPSLPAISILKSLVY